MARQLFARVLEDAFDAWRAYTRAMQADVRLESPFLSPRKATQDGQLVARLAAATGAVAREIGSFEVTASRRAIRETYEEYLGV